MVVLWGWCPLQGSEKLTSDPLHYSLYCSVQFCVNCESSLTSWSFSLRAPVHWRPSLVMRGWGNSSCNVLAVPLSAISLVLLLPTIEFQLFCFVLSFSYSLSQTFSNTRRVQMAILTSPPTAAVVVAMAGTILPAIRFVLNRSAFSILYILARKFYKGNRNVLL